MISCFTRRSHYFILLLAGATLTTGCHHAVKKDPDEGIPAPALYQKSHALMESGNWNAAATHFRRLVAQYPYGPITEQAILEQAYALYKDQKYDEALVVIDRFLRTYPTQANTPYMYYLRGLVNSNRETIFLRRVWSLDPSRRDLTNPHQAYNDFGIVVERFPQSRYASDAQLRMTHLRNLFAQHGLDIGLYYLRRGAYVSAAGRAISVLQTYPQSAFEADAIALLADAYTHLGNQVMAEQTRHRLESVDPQHPWLHGQWPKYPWAINQLNPFRNEKSPSTGDHNAHVQPVH